MSAEYQFTNKT